MKDLSLIQLCSYLGKRTPLLSFLQFCCALLAVAASFVAPEILARVVGTLLPSGHYSEASRYLLWGLLGLIILQLLQYSERILENTLAGTYSQILQTRVFSSVIRLPLSWHTSHGVPAATRSFFYDIGNVVSVVTRIVPMFFFSLVQIISVFTFMLLMNPTLSMVAVLPAFLLIASTWFSVRMIPSLSKLQISDANRLGTVFGDYLSRVRLLKALGAERAASRDLHPLIGRSAESDRGLRNFNSLMNSVSGLGASVVGILLIGFGMNDLSSGRLTLTELLRFLFFAGLLYQPIQRAMSFGETFLQARSSWENMRETLGFDSQPGDHFHPAHSVSKSAGLTLSGVSFDYDNRNILRDVSFTAREGELVGLVGRSGSGKSTLLSILAGYLTPTDGIATLDGIPLWELDKKLLREKVFYAGQDALLFDKTIKENLLIAKPYVCDEELWTALDRAGFKEKITQHPLNWNRPVGPNGSLLSGGERQRLLVAMLWLKNPDYLLLDEITSSLDAIADREVRSSLQELMRSRCTICVSHRLENIWKSDRIYVLEDGLITGVGTHLELLKDSPLYSELWASRSL
jgi:ABC-type multidrug transport system fused ATPase/permease subunit